MGLTEITNSIKNGGVLTVVSDTANSSDLSVSVVDTVSA